jgi:medium-chain acyl-[acyl-carrier-protein] hydrolase
MDEQLQERSRRWLKRYGRRATRPAVRLLCFHHAGGSAAMYRQWPRLLPPSIEPIAVQLPGRADRFREPAHDRMEPIVDDLIEVIDPLLDEPFACYGISMGARVAWALAHTLRRQGMPTPCVLYVAAHPAPDCDISTWPWEGREDDLVGYLRDLGGTPAAVLAEPELLLALLPALRADLAVLSTHRFGPVTPLDTPIHVFAGADDITTTPEQMSGWRSATSARFDFTLVPSGHFLDAEAERLVAAAISTDLLQTTGAAGQPR